MLPFKFQKRKKKLYITQNRQHKNSSSLRIEVVELSPSFVCNFHIRLTEIMLSQQTTTTNHKYIVRISSRFEEWFCIFNGPRHPLFASLTVENMYAATCDDWILMRNTVKNRQCTAAPSSTTHVWHQPNNEYYRGNASLMLRKIFCLFYWNKIIRIKLFIL